jgi:hypothetical protein
MDNPETLPTGPIGMSKLHDQRIASWPVLGQQVTAHTALGGLGLTASKPPSSLHHSELLTDAVCGITNDAIVLEDGEPFARLDQRDMGLGSNRTTDAY